MHPVVLLAKKAVEEYVTSREIIPVPETLSHELAERAGVFVCLKTHNQLRGCIGTFMPCHDTVAEEIIRNAVSAATQDSRFFPVGKDELPALEYSVDLLSPPEKTCGMDDLDPKRYGVIVVSGRKKGLLLPDLEEVETAEEQVRIAKMKAGIGLAEPVEIYRFEVRRFH